MSTEDFRRWKRSMSDWLKISKHSREIAVMNIRLTCEDKLQSAIDAQFPDDSWAVLTIDEAFDAEKSITTKTANSAIIWDRFFIGRQRNDETAKEYIHRCQKEALECAFACPNCNTDLGEYVLPRKIISGLKVAKLKQDILENSSQYLTVKAILAKCEAYEEAAKECSGAQGQLDFKAICENSIEQKSVENEEYDDLNNDVAAVKTGYKKKKENVAMKSNMNKVKCGFCGMSHPRGRSNCPAGAAKCFQCGKMGHFAHMCHSGSARVSGKGEPDGAVGTVIVQPSRCQKDDAITHINDVIEVGGASAGSNATGSKNV